MTMTMILTILKTRGRVTNLLEASKKEATNPINKHEDSSPQAFPLVLEMCISVFEIFLERSALGQYFKLTGEGKQWQ